MKWVHLSYLFILFYTNDKLNLYSEQVSIVNPNPKPNRSPGTEKQLDGFPGVFIRKGLVAGVQHPWQWPVASGSEQLVTAHALDGLW